ncbi:hypothetical protein B0T16DRAFT_430410 [Cercophora newfieldiana]|uniref:Meiotic recombination protein DMC1 n=1 Tax=Cercophora newfieldiana TaxID=92897 RepID=A0AA39Y404_9PEZI|nr:hypothetical protein B0T16DRAFT_430410 [Cercophora newfieldiana]
MALPFPIVGPSAGAPGGFAIPALPSPAPSATSTPSITGLPHPRGHALRPGSAKEDRVRLFAAARMSHISRRFAKRSAIAQPEDEVVGYKSMAELCKDVDALIDIIWLSGTPRLQIPYLLNIANELNTWLPSFQPSPRATFRVLQKLDHCFASLLSGQDYETKEPLPGFENGLRAGMSRTDMVRCKSMVQQTRVVIIDVMSEEPEEEEEEQVAQQPAEEDDDSDDGPTDWAKVDLSKNSKKKTQLYDDDDDSMFMDMARVYEKTLVKLGETLMDGGGVGDIQISDD